MTESDKPWMNPLVKISIQNRWDAFRRRDFSAYNHWKAKTKKMIIDAKRAWSSKSRTNCRNLWKVVNSVTGSKSSDSLYPLINQFDSADAAVNAINENFSSVFVDNGREISAPNTRTSQEVQWNVDITVSSVRDKLSAVKANKAMGSDGIPSILYKSCADLLAGPITHIFCLSIIEKRFPDVWKFSHVCPIPKSMPPDTDNLRPISLLPVPSKIL